MSIADLRREYRRASLDVREVDPDPVVPPADLSWSEKLKEYRKRWFGK